MAAQFREQLECILAHDLSSDMDGLCLAQFFANDAYLTDPSRSILSE